MPQTRFVDSEDFRLSGGAVFTAFRNQTLKHGC